MRSLLIIISILTLLGENTHLSSQGKNCGLALVAEITISKNTSSFIHDIEFDSSGNYLAYVSDDEFVIWDISNQQYKWRFPTIGGYRVVFGTGSKIALSANQSVYFWHNLSDANTWEELRIEGNTRITSVGDLQFNENGDELIASRRGHYGITRWSLIDGSTQYHLEELAENEGDFTIASMLSPDGKLSVTWKAGDGVFITNTDDNSIIGRIEPLNDRNYGLQLLAFVSPSRFLVSEQDSNGAFESKLLIVDISGEIIEEYTYGFNTLWTATAFNPIDDVLVLANGVDNQFYVYNNNYSQEICISESLHPMVTTLAFSPDGTLLASGGADGTVRLWGIPAGE